MRLPRMAVLKVLVGLLLAVIGGEAQGVSQCPFNTMCSCKPHNSTHSAGIPLDKSLEVIKDITCVGVPFSKFPDLPNGRLSDLDVMGSGLEVLETDSLGGAQLTSLRLITNNIFAIADRSLSVTGRTLQSLDLSHNELQEIPINALTELVVLDWLNLQSNHITSLSIDWKDLKETLTNLYLGDNDIFFLPLTPLYALSGFPRLTWLNLDSNFIPVIEPNALPFSLKTFSVSNNLLTVFPPDLLSNLKELTLLYMRGNYIEALPTQKYSSRKTLEKLDLAHNAIKTVANLFSGSITVKDLHLESNLIKVLPASAFKGVFCIRLYLSNNKIDVILDRAFFGLSSSLEYLDLENNQLSSVSKGIKQLKKLKYLYLAGNKISSISDDSFSNFSHSLRALSLSGNKLTAVPASSLRHLKKLNHLNLGYNHLSGPLGTNYIEWGDSLETLLLMGNKIERIKAGSFHNLKKVKELSLSFNRISKLDDSCFDPMSKTLQSLEISFGLLMEEFPEAALKPLSSLVWLALDFNEIRILTRTTLYTFNNLQYLNLEGNKIYELPEFFFHSSIHKNIKDIRLSFNFLHTLEPYTFSGLKELQSIVLTGNQINYIHENAFQNLPNTLTVILSDNLVNKIANKAFVNVPNLVKLDFHGNDLKEFTLSVFKNVTNPLVPMTLNLSSNRITELSTGDTFTPVYVKNLDLSYNQLSAVPQQFLNSFNSSLRRLNLGYNNIRVLDPAQFAKFGNIETLNLKHNGIITMKQDSFSGLANLQILDLSHNHIEQIHMQQFVLRNLRILDLSFNHLRSIPRDAFQLTRLERLILSHNDFVAIPTPPLIEIGYTLRVLDFSYNKVEHLDSTMFSDTPYLTDLNLSNNKLTLVPDNVLRNVGSLIRLDFSGNKLRSNFKELFHYLQKLRHLNLAETGLKIVPALPLPHLVHLNMSGNELPHLHEPFLAFLPKLRSLDVSRNQFYNLTGTSWSLAPFLSDVDVSNNPIKILTKDSFLGLENLQTLNVQSLLDLQRFDSDTLSKTKYMQWLKIQTWPKIEKYRFRLSRILSGLFRLKKLSVMVTEEQLSDQFGETFPAKLKMLEITGNNLKIVEDGCLEGLEGTKELAIHIHDTKIRSFPKGFFAKFANGGLSLDLRNNLVENFGPELFYKNPSQWKDIGTKVIPGGINVKDNPVVCSCQTKWLGEWMRRYLRESLQLHTVILETNQQVIATMKEASCIHNITRQELPILTYDQAGCDYINPAPKAQFYPGLLLLVTVVLFR